MAANRHYYAYPIEPDIENALLLGAENEDENEEYAGNALLYSSENETKKNVDTINPPCSPLQIALLQGLLEECLEIIKSAKRKYQDKTKISTTITFAAGVLMLIGGSLGFTLPEKAHKKLISTFEEDYNSIPIPNNVTNTHYTCKEVGVMWHNNFYNKNFSLSLNEPARTCKEVDYIIHKDPKGDILPNFNKSSIPDTLRETAWNTCSEGLLDLCKDFTAKSPIFSGKLLTSSLPLTMTFIITISFAIITLSLPVYLIIRKHRKHNATIKKVGLTNSEETERLLSIFSIFDLSMPSPDTKLSDFIKTIQAIETRLSTLEINALLDSELLPAKFRGTHSFFPQLKKMALPDFDNIEEMQQEATQYWKAACQANIFKR